VGDSALLIEGNGNVVPPGDPQAFARACQELLNISAERRRQIGMNARKRAEQFSIDSIVTRYEELYEQLTSRWHSAAAHSPILP
jgi:glycosyltransferase involved in cell wall biosynthesis